MHCIKKCVCMHVWRVKKTDPLGGGWAGEAPLGGETCKPTAGVGG